MPHPTTSSGQVTADWQGLAHLPQLLTDVKIGVLTLKTLITTPAAAVSTGSPPASGAIVLLGAELAMFLAQTVQAVEEDINGLLGVRRNYEQTEGEIAAEADRGQGVLDQVGGCPSPNHGGQHGHPTGTPTPGPGTPVTPAPSLPSGGGIPHDPTPTPPPGGWGGYPGYPGPSMPSYPGTPPYVPQPGFPGAPGSPGGGQYPGTPPYVPQPGFPGTPSMPHIPTTPAPAPMPGGHEVPGPSPTDPAPCPTGDDTPPAPTPRVPDVPPVPDAPTPTGDYAVDPSRRDDLLDAGHLAIEGLVDLVQVVGDRLECPTPSGQ